MTDHADFNRKVRRAAILTVALAACFVFGVIVLASGDWIPGGIIVAATAVGLAREVPVIQKLCSTESRPSPPKSKPAS
jgi:ABC-type methionine transport system permease subunit